MIFFEENRKLFKRMEILLFPVEQPTWKTFLINLIYFFVVGILYFTLGGAYIYEHLDNLPHCSNAIAVVVGSLCQAMQFVFFKFNQHKFGELLDDFETLIENCMYFVR